MNFHSLRIKEIISETPDTKTFVLDIPASLLDEYSYQAGQYITLKLMFGSHEVRRAYSMSSSPLDDYFAFTVKHVPGGKVTSYLHEKVSVGDQLEVGTPEGRFTAITASDKKRTWYLFGAGSGITPLYSIARTVLEQEPMSTVFLLYGNKKEEDIIFRDALNRLGDKYEGQLHVEYVLSQPKTEKVSSGLFGLFKKTTTNWNGKQGRISDRMTREFLTENPARGAEADSLYYICGPGNMAENVKLTLVGQKITAKQIYTEMFKNAQGVPGAGGSALGGDTKKVKVKLKGKVVEVEVSPKQTILDALVADKHDAPYSCTSGACSTCMAKLHSGKVEMEVCFALDDDEIKAGYILTCQAHPTTDLVEIEYE